MKQHLLQKLFSQKSQPYEYRLTLMFMTHCLYLVLEGAAGREELRPAA
jgi:hypothetical protein